MSKANQAFNQNDEAVSPVIGVILMVAITVVLAAVVFVLVSNLGSQQEQAENASAAAASPSSGVIEVTLVREGDSAGPSGYDNTALGSDEDDWAITINGVECGNADFSPASTDTWEAGEVKRISAGLTGCNAEFVAGDDDVSVSVTVAGTAILSTTVDVRA